MRTDPAVAELEKTLDILLDAPSNNAKLQESAFKEVILPILINYTPDMDTSAWVKITGTYDRGIDVYSDDGKEHLFTLPPMFTGFNSDPSSSNENSISKVVEDYKNMVGRMPAIADNMLLNKLNPRVKKLGLSEEQQAELAKITERYNVELTGVDNSKDVDTDYDFEDL